uniref:helix-turn-helix domain-containing protein n=1 Tax=Salipiger thiooxidans TaxID=282683 RepID=UPI001CFB2518|nr:helix-turn-helix domain-containing protein [Salipiger thiooxidans]
MGRYYLQLSFEERIKIAKWREAKMPIPEIADCLSRAPSTIYRDMKRTASPWRFTEPQTILR